MPSAPEALAIVNLFCSAQSSPAWSLRCFHRIYSWDPVCIHFLPWILNYMVPVAVFCSSSCNMSYFDFSQAGWLPLLGLGKMLAPFSIPPSNTRAVSLASDIFLYIWEDFWWHLLSHSPKQSGSISYRYPDIATNIPSSLKPREGESPEAFLPSFLNFSKCQDQPFPVETLQSGSQVWC